MLNPTVDRPRACVVGAFDSGVGGLSVLRAVRDALPAATLVYVADSDHAPYGDREPWFIARRADTIARFLLSHGADAIVVACNTATVVAVDALRAWCPVPVVGVEPAIKPGARVTRSGVVGVLATTRTVSSDAVQRLCRSWAADVDVRLVACPGLVEHVERGEIDGDATRALLRAYVAPLLAAGADTLVLGCTHYPFLAPALRGIVGDGVALIDPAEAVARQLVRRLGAAAQVAPGEPAGTTALYTSGSPEALRAAAQILWPDPVDVRALPAHAAHG